MRVSLWLDNTPERFILSEPLQKVLGIKEETRARIVASLWQYIKQNRLQDSDDRSTINLNSELQAIFGTDEEIKFHKILSILKPHLKERPPLELSIEVKRGDPKKRQFYQMPVTVHSDAFKKALKFLVSHNYEFDQSDLNDALPQNDDDSSSASSHAQKNET